MISDREYPRYIAGDLVVLPDGREGRVQRTEVDGLGLRWAKVAPARGGWCEWIEDDELEGATSDGE